MPNEKKWCPLLSMTPAHSDKQSGLCCESQCAWWNEANKSCAIAMIPSELAYGLDEIGHIIERSN